MALLLHQLVLVFRSYFLSSKILFCFSYLNGWCVKTFFVIKSRKASKKAQSLFNKSCICFLYLIAYPVCFYDHDADKTTKRCIWSAMLSIFIQLHISLFRIWSQEKWYQKVVYYCCCWLIYFFSHSLSVAGLHFSITHILFFSPQLSLNFVISEFLKIPILTMHLNFLLPIFWNE